MHNVSETIKNRKSVRTFDGREIEPETLEKLKEYAKNIANPLQNGKEYAIIKL